jgi:hypothetical protein
MMSEVKAMEAKNDKKAKILKSYSKWLPSRGNVLFTALAIGILVIANRAGALSLVVPAAPTLSTNTIPYQGRIANSAGTPLTGNYEITFALYNQLSGSTALWTETWAGGNSVRISDGLFNVLLGSLQPIPQSVITGNSNLWLGVKVGADVEMSPRVQLGSVPFATQALTVPDGSITQAKLAPNVQLGLNEISGVYTATITLYEGNNATVTPAQVQMSYRRIGSVVFVSMPFWLSTFTGNPNVIGFSLPFSAADGGNGGLTTNGGGIFDFEGIILYNQMQFRKPSGGFQTGHIRGGFWYVAQ